MSVPEAAAEKWGRDHYSTFMYIGHAVHNPALRGLVEKDKMRVKNSRRHMAGPSMAILMLKDTDRYPTRLQGGEDLHDHDDYDCADDLIAGGMLVETGTGFSRAYDLTPRGLQVWSYMIRTYPTAGSCDSITWRELLAAAGVSDAG